MVELAPIGELVPKLRWPHGGDGPMVEMAPIGELAPFSVGPKTEMAPWLRWPP